MEPEDEGGLPKEGVGPGDDEPDPDRVTELAVEALLLAALARRAAGTTRLHRVPFDTARLTPVERRVLLAYLSTHQDLHHAPPGPDERRA